MSPTLTASGADEAHCSPAVDIGLRLRQRRLAFESRADAAFEAAWVGVQALALPLKIEFDHWRSPSGRWCDFFAASPYRVLDLPMLLLEDLGQPDDLRRQELELAMLTANALAAAAVLNSELVLGAECSFGIEHGFLTSGLLAQAQWHLAAAGAPAAFTQRHALLHWNAHASAMLVLRQRWVQRAAPYALEDQAQLGQRWAPLKTAVFCAAVLAGRADLCNRLDPLLDEAAALFQLGRDLASLARDLARGHCSYPVASLLQALGGQVPAEGPLDGGHALLAAMLTDTLAKMAFSACNRAQALQRKLMELELPHVGQAMAAIEQPFADLITRHARQGQAAANPAPTFSLSHRPQREQVIDAAAGFLRNDPACQEAWEWYRWGYLDLPELVCRVFPTGMVLEHRIAAGEDCGEAVDALFEQYVSNHFHYFDQPTIQPPDFDTLGLMLRLAPHGKNPAGCRAQLETPLRWLLASIGPDGDIPVFMTGGFDEGQAERYLAMHGRRCAAVQAGVLLGLLGLNEDRFRPLLVQSGNKLFRWFASAGAATVRCYDLPYGGMLVLALIDALRHQSAWSALAGSATAAQSKAIELLKARRGRARASALDSALLMLASRFENCYALSDSLGLELLLRNQRQDGGWEAEPFYLTPSRGSLINWQASRLITTALARHALCPQPLRTDQCAKQARDSIHADAL